MLALIKFPIRDEYRVIGSGAIIWDSQVVRKVRKPLSSMCYFASQFHLQPVWRWCCDWPYPLWHCTILTETRCFSVCCSGKHTRVMISLEIAQYSCFRESWLLRYFLESGHRFVGIRNNFFLITNPAPRCNSKYSTLWRRVGCNSNRHDWVNVETKVSGPLLSPAAVRKIS